tara:strand:+ start:611 stop:1033 length:423 start_codon:yes stop_codon:yes gene_type:complete
MTVTDCTNSLFLWFQENDSFEMGEDFNKVILLSEDKDRDSAALEIALERLETAELIKSKSLNEKKYWILNKSFNNFESTVSIDATLSREIAEDINQFCEIIGDDTDQCDSSNITTKDIQNLLFMYRQAKQIVGKQAANEN